ncbi:phosphoglycerate mutase, partial [Candidatus Micrarchaeota archaeon]|nr:phosphoglycerate mutase [Candidatus Micrarchaeota archaeon]
LRGDPKETPEMLREKAAATAKALETYDFVFLHVKATDNAGHDGDFEGKKKAIENVDREIIPALAKTGACLVITGDHSTPCSLKRHSGDEVPVLLHGPGMRRDRVKKFDEMSCMEGGLGHIDGKDVMPIILDLLGKAEKCGS